MLSHLLLGMALLGAEWVLYALLALSIVSVALILERVWFYRKATKGLSEFREKVRIAAENGRWNDVKICAEERSRQYQGFFPDMESRLVLAMNGSHPQKDVVASLNEFRRASLDERTKDAIIRTKLEWERNLVFLATTGSNAPFVGLFGTVLGIIKAFHSLSEQSAAGVPTVTAGIAEALVATAVGILVAIPSVVAFNFFQCRIKTALSEAEALKSFLLARLT